MSPGADDVEIAHLWALRDATRRRRFALEEQAAHYGPGAPPHIPIELAQARTDEELIEARLRAVAVEPSAAVGAQIGTEGRIVILEHKHAMRSKMVDDALYQFRQELATIREEAHDWRAAERQQREERQPVVDAQLHAIEQRINRAFLLVGVVLGVLVVAVIILAVAVVWLLAQR